MDIEYITGAENLLDTVGPLWLKLRQHDAACSTYFGDYVSPVSWEQRKEGLGRKAREGRFRVDVVRCGEGKCIGYCITSLSADLRGEIESIYIDPEYRGRGIGDCLMRRALKFLDDGGAMVKILGVAVGNDAALRFYRRYGFLPRTTILQQRPESQGDACSR